MVGQELVVQVNVRIHVNAVEPNRRSLLLLASGSDSSRSSGVERLSVPPNTRDGVTRLLLPR